MPKCNANSRTLALGFWPSALCLRGERQTHGASRAAFEGAVHRAGIAYEVCTGPRVAREELEGEQLTLEPIARSACDDEVAGIMCPAAREWHDVVERRGVLVEVRGAVHAALPAVAQRHLAHDALHRDTGHRARPRDLAVPFGALCIRGACVDCRSPRRARTARRVTPRQTEH